MAELATAARAATTLYARATHDPSELRPDGLWAAILRSTADQGLGINAVYRAVRRPGAPGRPTKTKLMRALRHMAGHGLVEARGPIQPTDKGRQALAQLQEQP